VFEQQRGELSAVVELRRLFPGLGNTAWAGECVRTIALAALGATSGKTTHSLRDWYPHTGRLLLPADRILTVSPAINPWALAAERRDRAPARYETGGCGLVAKSSPEEYRERSEECDRLAASAKNAEVRKTLLHLAKRWREFERQAELVRPRLGVRSSQHPSN
jgi:hypothetical protein